MKVHTVNVQGEVPKIFTTSAEAVTYVQQEFPELVINQAHFSYAMLMDLEPYEVEQLLLQDTMIMLNDDQGNLTVEIYAIEVE